MVVPTNGWFYKGKCLKKTWMRTGSTPIFENPHMAKQEIEMGLLLFAYHFDFIWMWIE